MVPSPSLEVLLCQVEQLRDAAKLLAKQLQDRLDDAPRCSTYGIPTVYGLHLLRAYAHAASLDALICGVLNGVACAKDREREGNPTPIEQLESVASDPRA